MKLTGRQIVDLGIIYNVEEENIQQVGVDLNLIEVHQILGGGAIFDKRKTKLPKTEVVPLKKGKLSDEDDKEGSYWLLSPGTYSIVLKQGCNIPADKSFVIVQRSSLLRNGGILQSSIFDPGFSTANIGTVMIVTTPIAIEYSARIGQAVVSENHKVDDEDLYDGQFNRDVQRKNELG